MSLVKSIPEISSTYVNIERAQLGSLFSSPFAMSTSPKTQRLSVNQEIICADKPKRGNA
jgi:hypothetical protein